MGINFLNVNQVAADIQLSQSYLLYSGSRSVGEIVLEYDPWAATEKWIVEGEVRKARVASIGWTVAGLIMDGEVYTWLNSQDVGLPEWAEISQALKVGDVLEVYVEEVDQLNRVIKVSWVERINESAFDEESL